MKKSTKITAICHNPNCEKEFQFIPSRKQKYCSHKCFLDHPDNKKKRRAKQSYLFNK